MNRRAFIMLIGGAAAWPLGTRAQQPGKVPQVGLLDPGVSHLFEAFRQGMRDLGYFEARNISYVYRSAQGRAEGVDRLASGGGLRCGDQLRAPGRKSHRPVVSEPRAQQQAPRIVARDVAEAPPRGRVVDQSVPRSFVQVTEEAARQLGLEVQLLAVPGADAFDDAFEAAVRERAEALNVLSSANFNAHRVRLAQLAARYRLPTMYESGEYVRDGGLMAYGPSLPDLFRRAASYVDKILRGAKPANLPVEQPTKFEFLVNLKAAKALGLDIPDRLLSLTDEVIE